MIKIMIVDDEFSVRLNIKRMLEMPSDKLAGYKYMVVGEASNGREAINLLESVSPDLIISDIRMPCMNGIELQEYLLHKRPQIKMVMLSGYDDYEYVRSALKKGALDYVLKYELNQEILAEIFKTYLLTNSSKNEDFEPAHTDSYLALKRDFIRKLIMGYYQTEKGITERLRTLNLRIGLKNIRVVLMTVPSNNNNMKTDYLVEFSILNIVDEILQECGQGVCCKISDEKYAFLMSYKNIYSEKIRDEQYNALCARISSCLKKYLDIATCFYAGKVVSTIMDCKSSKETAEYQYVNRYYKEVRVKEFQPFDILAIFGCEQENALLTAVREKSCEKAVETVKNIFERLNNYKATTFELQNLFVDILSTLNRAWKEQSVDISTFYAHENIRERFQEFNSLKMIEEWFLKLIKESFEEERINVNNTDSLYISKAITYIHTHYSEDISLNDVALEVGISPAYFSKIFKEDLGIGFARFLCDYRIKKAKRYLLKSKLSNKEVAQKCGFQDDAYFAKVFKKNVGMTPMEYRIKNSSDFTKNSNVKEL